MNRSGMIRLALDESFSAAAVIDLDQIFFDPTFRKYCEENLCGQYGANHSCPPDCGTPEAMKQRLIGYRHALVFQSKWEITDYHDVQAINAAKRAYNQGMLRAIARLRQAGYAGLMAGASCCNLCEKCARIDSAPCRDPETCFSCLSAYCIHVKKLAEVCGMEYVCADGKLALFGMYAF